jgi:molybdopterin-guanine dinucleotide biosynthesis protein A
MNQQLTGAIIAGGASSRFSGKPKGLSEIAGRRIIDRVANALRGVAPHLVLVTNASDGPEWLPGVPVAQDVRAERGSLVGIHTALSSAGTAVMVVAWDMPFVTRELLTLIRDRGHDETFVTAPEGPDGLEPFCARYGPSCLPILDAAIDAGELRLSSVLRRFPSVTRVTRAEVSSVGDPARMFFNVNTPEDLDVARRIAAEP